MSTSACDGGWFCATCSTSPPTCLANNRVKASWRSSGRDRRSLITSWAPAGESARTNAHGRHDKYLNRWSMPTSLICIIVSISMKTLSSPSTSSLLKFVRVSRIFSFTLCRNGHASLRRLPFQKHGTWIFLGCALCRCSTCAGQVQHMPQCRAPSKSAKQYWYAAAMKIHSCLSLHASIAEATSDLSWESESIPGCNTFSQICLYFKSSDIASTIVSYLHFAVVARKERKKLRSSPSPSRSACFLIWLLQVGLRQNDTKARICSSRCGQSGQAWAVDLIRLLKLWHHPMTRVACGESLDLSSTYTRQSNKARPLFHSRNARKMFGTSRHTF